MRVRWSYLLTVVACIALSGCNSLERSGLNPGDPAPKFSLPLLNGETAKLEDYRGKVVLLNFWASWCQPCVAELQSLQQLYADLHDEGLVILGVGIDDAPADLDQARRTYGLSYPILVDSAGATKTLYKMSGVPESFVLDKEGRVVLIVDPAQNLPSVRMTGPREWHEPAFKNQITALLRAEN